MCWTSGLKYSTPSATRKHSRKFSALRIANFNVRTMIPGFSDDLQLVYDKRKTTDVGAEKWWASPHCKRRDLRMIGHYKRNSSRSFERKMEIWQTTLGLQYRHIFISMIEPHSVCNERLNFSTGSVIPVRTKRLVLQWDRSISWIVARTEDLYYVCVFNTRVGTEHDVWVWLTLDNSAYYLY